MRFSQALKNEISDSELSLLMVADCLGISLSSIKNWCSGAYKPCRSRCRDLDEFFNKPSGYFEELKK